jgi:hypothetical protein
MYCQPFILGNKKETRGIFAFACRRTACCKKERPPRHAQLPNALVVGWPASLRRPDQRHLTLNPSILFSGIVRPHPDQCL